MDEANTLAYNDTATITAAIFYLSGHLYLEDHRYNKNYGCNCCLYNDKLERLPIPFTSDLN